MKHILSSGLVAGLAVGLLCALLQYLLLEPQILLAERYESGELVHFEGVAGGGSTGQSQDHATAEAGPGDAASTTAGHGDASGAEPSATRRNGLTVLFAVLTYAGYGLLMAGGMALASQFGVRIGGAEAILWGLAGFLAFQMMPALGLEPELPGTPSADLTARQIWWAGTAIATVAGLALLAYGEGWLYRVLGVGLLALPHVVGAPGTEGFAGVAPPELASSFAARSLGIGLLTWTTLGLAVHGLSQGARR